MKYAIIILALVGILLFLGLKFTQPPVMKTDPPPSYLTTKTSSESGVTMTVTPGILDKTFSFRITLDTHTEELNADLKQVSTLTADQDQIYEPLEWEGDPPGGHHREGILRFPVLDSRPEMITLKIKEVGGVPEWVFSWFLYY